MAPILYMIPASPPVRSVLITAKAIGLELEEKLVNILAKDNLKPEYLKLNPQHTVPTLTDDGFTFWDSHAINAYLVSKYAKNDSLYPTDLRKRALVNQRLHFDSGVAFDAIRKIMGPIIISGEKTVADSNKEYVNQVYAFLETFLDGNQWVAGDAVTIADYNLYTSVTALNALVAIDGQKYPKVVAWLKKVDGLPEVEVSKKGLADFEGFVKSKLS